MITLVTSVSPDRPLVVAEKATVIPGRSVGSCLGRVKGVLAKSFNSWEIKKPQGWNYKKDVLSLLYEVPDKEQIAEIPVTIINHSPSPLSLKKGATIGQMFPSLEVVTHEHKENALDPDEFGDICEICCNLEKNTVWNEPDFGVNKLVKIPDSCNKVDQNNGKTLRTDTQRQDTDASPEKSTGFITSPADVTVYTKPKLIDHETPPEIKKALEKLCDKFQKVFSQNPADIGQTPLIEMDIPTGDSPPIAQKPYPLALKHADWVKKELLELEQAGIIVKSVSPWASPIVVVPKKSAPGEPPRRRMCVDYRALNALLPAVKKVGSNAKGVLTLIPLPKIDDLFAELGGSSVFTSLDLRMGLHCIDQRGPP